MFLISLLFVCIAQKVSFKVFASMSEGRRERATQWFNFRFLLTKANSAGNYSSVVPNLGSFSFSCLKNKIAIYNFWASKISSLFILFSWQHCVLTSAQSVWSNNSGASHEAQWRTMACYGSRHGVMFSFAPIQPLITYFILEALTWVRSLSNIWKKPFPIKTEQNLLFLLLINSPTDQMFQNKGSASCSL